LSLGDERKFWIPVYRGLFRHYGRIKQALWLFLWYIDKTTREECEDCGRVGYVLGGAPVKDQAAAYDLGCDRSTVSAWRRMLEDAGYVRTKRVPNGNVVCVLNSKKWVVETMGQSSHHAGQSSHHAGQSSHHAGQSSHAIREYREDICEKAEVQAREFELGPDGYSPIDGQTWKTAFDHVRFSPEIEKLLAAKGGKPPV
jgi:hypothetical protein